MDEPVPPPPPTTPPPPPLMRARRGLSLKYKLLMMLIILPTLSLTVYIGMAITKFQDDKKSYVQGAGLSHTNTVGSQIRSGIETFRANLRPIIEGYQFDKKTFDATSQSVFNKEKNLQYLAIYAHDGEGHLTKTATLIKTEARQSWLADVDVQAADLAAEARSNGFAMELQSSDHGLIMAERYKIPNQNLPIVVVGLTANSEIQHSIQKKDFYSTYLLKGSGTVVMGPLQPHLSIDFSQWVFFKEVLTNPRHEGVKETHAPNGTPLIASFSKVGVGDFIILSFVDRKAAFRAVEELLKESIAFFVALLSLMAIISVIAARKLTSSLRELARATERVAQGDFDIEVAVTSKDEVGTLASGFNHMAEEVKRLMAETADKARMEKELETAKTVQETLFPANSHTTGLFQISGFYEPASECGGDWWHYCEIGNKIYLWIGDATGHGAPAALVTSAAKAAASIIEKLGPLAPSQALELMNKAIHETSKGKILMTFFLAAIDKSTGKVTYCNASHDPPFLIKKSSEPLKKKDMVLLNEVTSPRLGQTGDTKFQEATFNLNTGDTILFYTDGIMDIRSPGHENWGERQFVKTALHAAIETSADKAVEHLRDHAQEYRQNTPLDDDITFFFCKFEKAA